MNPFSTREPPSDRWRRLVTQSTPALRRKLTVVTIALVVLIGLADFLLPTEVSVLVFYFVPVTLAVVCRGWKFGVATAFACVSIWLAGDFAAGVQYASRLVPVWNGLIVFLTFLVIVALLTGLLNLQRDLEARVARRTAALAAEVAERERLEKAVLDISERERRRIGHDLHDSLGQHLTGTALTGQVLLETLHERDAPESADARKLVGLIKSAIEQTRQMAKGLLLADIDSEGLAPALHEFSVDTSRQFHVDCRFRCDEPVVLAGEGVASHLYRIGQEAIRNAIRHGRARHIDVQLGTSPERVVLCVMDDGIGLPPADLRGPGIGIRIMAHRARMIGADFAIEPRSTGGTAVTCLLPNSRHA